MTNFRSCHLIVDRKLVDDRRHAIPRSAPVFNYGGRNIYWSEDETCRIAINYSYDNCPVIG